MGLIWIEFNTTVPLEPPPPLGGTEVEFPPQLASKNNIPHTSTRNNLRIFITSGNYRREDYTLDIYFLDESQVKNSMHLRRIGLAPWF